MSSEGKSGGGIVANLFAAIVLLTSLTVFATTAFELFKQKATNLLNGALQIGGPNSNAAETLNASQPAPDENFALRLLISNLVAIVLFVGWIVWYFQITKIKVWVFQFVNLKRLEKKENQQAAKRKGIPLK